METRVTMILLQVLMMAVLASNASNWYTGDDRCKPPQKDDTTYSAPYNALDFPYDYPTFDGADKRGWYCSYQREDGVIVQFGDSRTPQEKWKDLYGSDRFNRRFMFFR